MSCLGLSNGVIVSAEFQKSLSFHRVDVRDIRGPDSVSLENRKCVVKSSLGDRKLRQIHQRWPATRIQVQRFLEVFPASAPASLLIRDHAQDVVSSRQLWREPSDFGECLL